jgi:hypothetical protein
MLFFTVIHLFQLGSGVLFKPKIVNKSASPDPPLAAEA